MDELIQDFWRTVTYRLPRLNGIILSDDKDRSETPNDIQSPLVVYRKVGELCPPSINVFVYLLQGDGSLRRRMKRKLWRLVNDKGVTNTSEIQERKLCTDHPGPDMIPPYKVWRGPVGLYEDCYARVCDVAAQRKAIKVQRIAAMESFHFYGVHKPFNCSAADCDAYFEQPEGFISHVIETKHDLTARLPEHAELAFAENNKRLDRLAEIAHELKHPFLERWGESGSKERRVAEREFIYQLEHDPLYAKDGSVTEHPQLHAVYRSIDGGGM